jgi:ABC-2 type transport system permease protein
VGWGALVAALVVGQLGELLGLPQAVLDLSPFGHTPALPAADLVWRPLLVLAALAAALLGAALLAFRRRDVRT